MPEVALEYIDADLVPGRQVYAVVVRFGVELLKNSVLCFFCFFWFLSLVGSFLDGNAAALCIIGKTV